MNAFLELTAQEIDNLYQSIKDGRKMPTSVRQNIMDAWWFKVWQASDADENFPKHDNYGDIVIMIHESVCPACGCGLQLVEQCNENPMGQHETTSVCRNGHKAYAIPSEDGFGDWFGDWQHA